MKLKIGDVLRMPSVKTFKPEGNCQVAWSSGKHGTNVFVALYLGTEPQNPKRKSDVLDVPRQLNQMGWYSADQLEAVLGDSAESVLKQLRSQ